MSVKCIAPSGPVTLFVTASLRGREREVLSFYEMANLSLERGLYHWRTDRRIKQARAISPPGLITISYTAWSSFVGPDLHSLEIILSGKDLLGAPILLP